VIFAFAAILPPGALALKNRRQKGVTAQFCAGERFVVTDVIRSPNISLYATVVSHQDGQPWSLPIGRSDVLNADGSSSSNAAPHCAHLHSVAAVQY
jgi:hypothetical protein